MNKQDFLNKLKDPIDYGVGQAMYELKADYPDYITDINIRELNPDGDNRHYHIEIFANMPSHPTISNIAVLIRSRIARYNKIDELCVGDFINYNSKFYVLVSFKQ